jgi:hypothetical protein
MEIEKDVGVDPLGRHPQDRRIPPVPGYTQCVAQWESKN